MFVYRSAKLSLGSPGLMWLCLLRCRSFISDIALPGTLCPCMGYKSLLSVAERCCKTGPEEFKVCCGGAQCCVLACHEVKLDVKATKSHT